jgi:hypothetical protein
MFRVVEWLLLTPEAVPARDDAKVADFCATLRPTCNSVMILLYYKNVTDTAALSTRTRVTAVAFHILRAKFVGFGSFLNRWLLKLDLEPHVVSNGPRAPVVIDVYYATGQIILKQFHATLTHVFNGEAAATVSTRGNR